MELKADLQSMRKIMKEEILFNISLQNISLRRSSAHYFASRMLFAAYLQNPGSENRDNSA